ncbi:hypothetical protein GCM10009808_15290 [Microbacterium sediminicola]|uniref:DM13 domain-containing protein n=1 Tax=Microbacterium sediminicola TaxID=415210 RepID=A0ABN2I4Y7_9MICO
MTGAAFLATLLALTGCATTTTDTTPETGATATATATDDMDDMEEMDEPMVAASSGTFEGLNGQQVSGTVEIHEEHLVLTGFSSDEGPDLHVYLTNGTDEDAVANGIELGTVAWDEADQQFDLNGMDTAMYTTVVIHCDKAAAVFGAAELS